MTLDRSHPLVCKWEGQQREGEAIMETAAASQLVAAFVQSPRKQR